MDNRTGDLGTTPDGATGQTQEIMPGASQGAVPTLDAASMQKAPDHRAELTPERKAEIEIEARRKMDLMQAEYWRMRNGKQVFMRCPYCGLINLEDQEICCNLFAKAFGAILDRQKEVDIAASHVRACHKVGLVH